MIAHLLANQISKRRKEFRSSKNKKEEIQSDEANLKKTNFTKNYQQVDKIGLLKRYVHLVKTTMLSFIFSTVIHIGIITSYYYIYLWLHPDDPGKKKFYATTSVSPGIHIGGRVIGGGGIQTNHHKSYLLHLVREHYKSASKLFFVEFSAIYLVFLTLLKFFPERAKLKEDTEAAFRSEISSKEQIEANNQAIKKTTKSTKPKNRLCNKKKLVIKRNKKTKKSYDSDSEQYEDLTEEETSNDVFNDNLQDKKMN